MTIKISDMQAILASTLKIYRESLSEAARGFVRNWWAAFLPIVYVFILMGLMTFTSAILPSIVVGFINGLLIALCLANYFAFVSAGVEKETLLRREIKHETFQLFRPSISVMFFLFIIGLLVSMIFSSNELFWIRAAINLFLVIGLNAIPEIIYLSRNYATAIVIESFEFIQENFIEWFVPILLVGLPLIIAAPKVFLTSLATANPIMIAGFFFNLLGSFMQFGLKSHSVMIAVVSLLLTFYFMIFRGILYKKLSCSTRRKRIYQYKMEG